MRAKLSAEQGFTLIELMIAITLGLIVSAAALMIFLSSQRSLALQGGMSEIQQNSIFGLTAVTHDIRHANLDTESDYISAAQTGSGIVFNTAQTSVSLTDEQVTRANAYGGIMDVANDQLTVQYKVRTKDMYDCEGALLDQDVINVQRYFVKALPNTHQPANWTNDQDPRTRYGLYCDAANSSVSSTGMNDATAALIVPDVESFKLSLVTRNLNGTPADRSDDTVIYQALGDYINRPAGDTVIAIEIGVVMRSSNSVHQGNTTGNAFVVAGQAVQTNAATNYLRVPINQVVAIRNSQGVE